MTFRIIPYKQGSKGAKTLAEALGGKVLKLAGGSWRASGNDVVINWGNSDPGEDLFARATRNGADYLYNGYGYYIGRVSNKLNFFQDMVGRDWLPPFWTNKDDIPDEAFPIVCRTILTGHSGAGIVIADSRDDLVLAPLYVKYMEKKDEYRVHCGRKGDDATVISFQRKARRLDCENPNWQIRNHTNGFVYVREGVLPPSCVVEASLQTFYQTGLDFGAVDVIYNEQENRAYVLEVNTAPGLEGQTVTDYANFLREVSA